MSLKVYGDSNIECSRENVQICIRMFGHLVVHGLGSVERSYDILCKLGLIQDNSLDELTQELKMDLIMHSRDTDGEDMQSYNKYRMANWITAILCEFAWSGLKLGELYDTVRPSEIIKKFFTNDKFDKKSIEQYCRDISSEYCFEYTPSGMNTRVF